MKKLLEILGTITITGSGVLTLVANSPVSAKKQQTKLESSDINYLQTNNLGILNRTKRQNNNFFHVPMDSALKIKGNDKNSFKDSHNQVFRALMQAGILSDKIFSNVPSTSATAIHDNNEIVLLNKDSKYNGFLVPVIIEENSQFPKIELVFRTRDLYLEGFIVNNSYYYFSNAIIKSIANVNSTSLGFEGDYKKLFVDANGNGININVDWGRVFNSFKTLSNYQGVIDHNIKNSLGVIAVVVAENWRFRTMNDLINEKVINSDSFITFGVDKSDTNNRYQMAMKWPEQGVSVLKQVNDIMTLPLSINQDSLPYSYYFDANHNPRIDNAIWGVTQSQLERKYGKLPKESRNKWKKWFINSALPNIPINVITDQIYNSHTIRILFLIAVNYAFTSCQNPMKRDVNQNLNQEFCDLQSDVAKIRGDIISIQILDENTKGGDRQAGDAYVGTTEGMYLIRNNTGNVSSYYDWNFSIVDIKLDDNGGAFVLTNENNVLHLRANGLAYSKLENIRSSNLGTEMKLFYDENHNNKQVYLASTGDKFRNYKIINLELGKINPLDYKKIEFLGDVDADCWGVKTKWGSWIYSNKQDECPNSDRNRGKNIKQYLKDNNNDFHKLVKNIKVSDINDSNRLSVANLELQNFEDKDVWAWLGAGQYFGLSFFWENGNYYLQVMTYQSIDWRASEASLEGWIKIGNGVRLYND